MEQLYLYRHEMQMNYDSKMTGIRKNANNEYAILGIPYAQYIKGEFDFSKNIRIDYRLEIKTNGIRVGSDCIINNSPSYTIIVIAISHIYYQAVLIIIISRESLTSLKISGLTIVIHLHFMPV